MSRAAAPPHQYSVDLAGTGRACCKKCSRTILVYQPRFCRKVRSPWHDGFDIQFNHLACGRKWCDAMTEIHRLGILDFRDLQRAADIWEFDLRAASKSEVKLEQNNCSSFKLIQDPADLLVDFSAYKTMINMIKKIRDLFLDAGTPSTTMLSILCHNGYDEQMFKTTKFFTIPILAHMISDALLRGIPAVCPVCQQMSLVSFGFSYYCYGWLAATTRCDYWSSQNPFGNPTEDNSGGRYLMEDTRDQSLMIPAQHVSIAIWKRVGQLLKKLREQQEHSIYEGWKYKVLSGQSKRRNPKQAALLETWPRSQLMAGLYVGTWGSLKLLDRDKLGSAIERYGGAYTTDCKQLGNPPAGRMSICLIDPDNWPALKASETSVISQTGATILKEEYMMALVSKGGAEKGKWPTIGAKLRLASEMKAFRLGGGKSFDVPIPQVVEDDTPKPMPAIQRDSPLMELHPDLLGPLDDPDYHRIIYVDRLNHAYNARLSKVELRDNKNTYYVLQLVEVSRVRADINRKRIATSANVAAKRSKKSEAGGQKDCDADNDKSGNSSAVSRQLLPETVDDWRALLYESEIIDHASWSDDLWRQSEMVKSAKYSIYRAWGRLGEDDKRTNGAMMEDFQDLDECKEAYFKKFTELTGLNFYKRREAEGVYGFYQVVDLRGYIADKKSDKENTSKEDNQKPKTNELSELDGDVREVILDIFSQRYVTATLKEFQIDKTKFRELSGLQIAQAYQILSDIESVLSLKPEGPDEQARQRARLRGLSASLYTVIPRITRKLEPITDLAMLKRECALTDALSSTADSLSILSTGSATDHYESMKIKVVRRVQCSEPCYKVIRKYLRNGHGITHGSRQYELDALYQLRSLDRIPSDTQKLLLWHGTRASNLASIVCHGGLMIAPPEAPKSGYMFDKGLYFTDVASKAAQYCAPTESGDIIYLFLFQVDLGERVLELENANETLLASEEWMTGQYTAVKGCGRIAPGSSEELSVDLTEDPHQPTSVTLIVPSGKHKKGKSEKSALIYNEYIVYEPQKTEPLFLASVIVEFKAFTEDF